MADVFRTRAELLSLLADNTTGEISAQDLRDLVMSIVPAFGHIYLATPAATSIPSTGTWVKAAGTTAAGDLYNFTSPTSNRLTLSASIPVRALILCSGSISAAAAAQQVRLRVGVKNSASALTEVVLDLTDANTSYAFSTHLVESLQPNDWVELFVANDTSTSSLTVDSLTLTIIGLMAQS